MTTRKDDGRKVLQLTMKPELYDQVKEHCQQLDIPVTVWARELIKRAMESNEI